MHTSLAHHITIHHPSAAAELFAVLAIIADVALSIFGLWPVQH